MSATVINVTEHITGSELVESPTALYPSTSLYPSAELIPGGGLLYPSETTFPSATLFPSGASTLEVADLGEFDQDGGQLTIGSETHFYAVLGEGAQADGSGFLQLADSLTGTYRAGEPVYEYPRVVERWAEVLEPNGDNVLQLRIPHTLYALLPVGIRGPDEGEQVTFAADGTDAVVTDILGRFPVQDLNSELITTDPSQSGQRVDIDSDGIREYEADGTTVAVSLTQGEGLDLLADTDEANNVTRMLRWLLANGNELAYLSASENTFLSPDFDSLVLRITAQGVSNLAALGLYATDGSGNNAGIKVLTGPTFNGEVYALSAGTSNRLLLDAAGVSDYAFADGSNLGGWQDWTPTLSGWSANPTNSVYRYKQVGKLVVVSIRQATAGTSNATTKTISAPVTAATITNMVWSETCAATDNGTDLAASSQVSISSGSSTINFAKDLSTLTGGWTAAGGHKIKYTTLIYESA